MANRKKLTKKRIAYHEAGHVAIGFYFNREIEYVTITPNKKYGFGGYVAFAEAERFRRKKDGSLDKRSARRFAEHVMIILGGGAAQSKHDGYENLDSFEEMYTRNLCSDFKDITSLIDNLAIGEEEKVKYISELTFEVLKLFEQENLWSFVRSLSEKLLVEKRLTGRRCFNIYKKFSIMQPRMPLMSKPGGKEVEYNKLKQTIPDPKKYAM